jgi:hypothetical protein
LNPNNIEIELVAARRNGQIDKGDISEYNNIMAALIPRRKPGDPVPRSLVQQMRKLYQTIYPKIQNRNA